MNMISEELLSGIVYASDAHLAWEDLKRVLTRLIEFAYDSYTKLRSYNKMKRIGREQGSLYLTEGTTNDGKLSASVKSIHMTSSNKEQELWHMSYKAFFDSESIVFVKKVF
ncbi:uncharacterized protein LOC107840618 isoform X3 [Capsicum annuum]|uniref:uncharacterized protein LOC107840618 isoform X3 n=1 Tax=Capsicum annuum TaxID=4072 RepID=UPI001FB11C0B|nr:uncharacterized protein LOC107840618 isoform X3 [Capsicum annuum]